MYGIAPLARLPNFVFPQIERESGKPVPAWVRDNVPNWLLPWQIFSDGPPPEPEERVKA